jgi:hypothetical protein
MSGTWFAPVGEFLIRKKKEREEGRGEGEREKERARGPLLYYMYSLVPIQDYCYDVLDVT